MSPFKKILLCVHPEITDPNVVDHAARVARKYKSAVRVMHTISDYPEDIGEWWNVQNPEALRRRIVEERQEYLDGITEFLDDLGVEDKDSRIRWGQPTLEIIREVLESEHDLVIITASQRSHFTKKMLDCPSLELMRHCPATIWVAQGKIEKRYQRIGVALGDYKGDIRCDGVNARAFETAVLVANAEKAEFHVIHALPLYGVDNNRIDKDRLARTLRDKHQMIKDRCGSMLEGAELELPDERIHIPVGSPPALQIKKVVEKQMINLMVMGSTMSYADVGISLGNTSEKVFTHAKVSMVSVKPPGFSSQFATKNES